MLLSLVDLHFERLQHEIILPLLLIRPELEEGIAHGTFVKHSLVRRRRTGCDG